MGLINNHSVVAGRNIPDLVDDKRELLQGGDDDPCLLPRESLGQLARVLIDLYDNSARMLELIDRVLQLAVEDHAVGYHHHFVENFVVTQVVQRGKPMSGPGDGVGLP